MHFLFCITLQGLNDGKSALGYQLACNGMGNKAQSTPVIMPLLDKYIDINYQANKSSFVPSQILLPLTNGFK